MNQNQARLYTNNNLSSHASLLLSASPTIITNSPLQNNTNNPQSLPVPCTIARAEDPSQATAESYINFKKPQNEIFKKLDGKIEKIKAAHSNLNKLYALNDFSSLGVGPKRPFELPPQLPPPPPWIPKVAAEYGNNSVPGSSSSTPPPSVEGNRPKITPEQFSLITQKIKETLENAKKAQDSSESLSPNRKFRDLAAKLRASSLPPRANQKIQTIKVIVPPTDATITSNKSFDDFLSPESNLTYQVIKNKIRLFQSSHGSLGLKKNSRKSLDKVVNRLKAKYCLESEGKKAGLQEIINSFASLLQSSRAPTISAPTPIPVFRKPLCTTSKGTSKSKKSGYFGLKIDDYMEKEKPPPELLSIEQFAKCLNLVRSNDASLKLLQSRSRVRISNRPIRLKRLCSKA